MKKDPEGVDVGKKPQARTLNPTDQNTLFPRGKGGKSNENQVKMGRCFGGFRAD
jgi:hypothetical protein